MLRTAELLQHVAHLIEDKHSHHLTFDHDNATLVIHRNASRMLQNVCTELAHELSILIVDLNLVRWTAFGHDKVTCERRRRI